MAKNPDRKDAGPELAQAEARIEAIKAEIARAMTQRNALPKSATDEEKAAAAARVRQLHAQHHEAVQRVMAIKHEETAKLEREHKERKQRQKRLKASRQPSGQTADRITPPIRTHRRPPVDRATEEAQMDTANEVDLYLERQRLEEEDRESDEELAHLRRVAEKRRREEEVARLQEAKRREVKEAEARAEAARLKAEKEARAKIRQQAALQRAEEARAKKRQQRTEREARQRAPQDARSSGWFGKILRLLKAFLGGPG